MSLENENYSTQENSEDDNQTNTISRDEAEKPNSSKIIQTI